MSDKSTSKWKSGHKREKTNSKVTVGKRDSEDRKARQSFAATVYTNVPARPFDDEPKASAAEAVEANESSPSPVASPSSPSVASQQQMEASLNKVAAIYSATPPPRTVTTDEVPTAASPKGSPSAAKGAVYSAAPPRADDPPKSRSQMESLDFVPVTVAATLEEQKEAALLKGAALYAAVPSRKADQSAATPSTKAAAGKPPYAPIPQNIHKAASSPLVKQTKPAPSQPKIITAPAHRAKEQALANGAAIYNAIPPPKSPRQDQAASASPATAPAPGPGGTLHQASVYGLAPSQNSQPSIAQPKAGAKVTGQPGLSRLVSSGLSKNVDPSSQPGLKIHPDHTVTPNVYGAFATNQPITTVKTNKSTTCPPADPTPTSAAPAESQSELVPMSCGAACMTDRSSLKSPSHIENDRVAEALHSNSPVAKITHHQNRLFRSYSTVDSYKHFFKSDSDDEDATGEADPMKLSPSNSEASLSSTSPVDSEEDFEAGDLAPDFDGEVGAYAVADEQSLGKPTPADRYTAMASGTKDNSLKARLGRIESMLEAISDKKPRKGTYANAEADADAPVSLSSADHLYNRRFQEILADPSLKKHFQLATLGNDFVKLAEQYGKIIISERCLSYEKKSIKPIGGLGVAGGEKFIVQGILFKYAVDTVIGTTEGGEKKWMYGGVDGPDDAAAMRGAGNEMVALAHVVETNVVGLHYPLMAIIDYVGYRLVAVSTLPISKRTIVYGSGDAGRTVHNSDEEAHRLMSQVGDKLNLKEHLVFDKKITGPGDIEVHRASDGRLYIIDFARTFPPERLVEGENPQLIFSRLLRPELLKKFSRKLSSDAFSGWQLSDPDYQQLNKDVEEACEFLEQVINEYPTTRLKSRHFQQYFIGEVCGICDLRRNGINVRHLGKVRAAADRSGVISDFYLMDMIARIIKLRLRKTQRDLMGRMRLFAEDPFKKAVIDALNLVASPSQYLNFWSVELKDLLVQKFGPEALREKEKSHTYNLLDSLGIQFRGLLLWRLLYLIGLQYDDDLLTEAQSALKENREFEFSLIDFAEGALKPKIKYMPIIDLANAISMYTHATVDTDQARQLSNIRLLREAKLRLRWAFDKIGDAPDVKLYMGLNYTALAKLGFKPDDLGDLARGLLMFKTYVDDYPEGNSRRQALVGTVANALLMLIATNETENPNKGEYQDIVTKYFPLLIELAGVEGAYEDLTFTLKPWLDILFKSNTRVSASLTDAIRQTYKTTANQVIQDFVPAGMLPDFVTFISAN